MIDVRQVMISEDVSIGGTRSLAFIGGPCVIESEQLVMETAEKIQVITEKLGLSFIFKSSFDKANRSSIASFRGLGMEESMKILGKVKKHSMYRLLLMCMRLGNVTLLPRLRIFCKYRPSYADKRIY